MAKGKTPEEHEDLAKSAMFDRYWNNAVGARKELDWKWFQYDLWVSGNHYAKWDKNTQQITTSPKADGSAKIVINKVYSTLRGVRSYVLQNRPKAEVTPYNITDSNIDQAINLNEYLNYLHDRLHLRQSLRASMWHALKYSVGFWQVLFDDSANEGEGEITVNVVDPFDLYWDPVARLPKEARYVILAVRRNIADLKEDPKYKDAPWDKIGNDASLAASSLKARIMQYERGYQTQNEDKKDSGTVIVKEFWYKEQSDEEVEVDDPENTGKKIKGKQKKTKIMLCTRVGDVTIRKEFDTGLDRFPFFRLSSDIEPLSMYGTGWVKNLVPLNRLLERLEGSGAEYNDVVNKGKWITDKGAGVRIINNEHGQIIEKKRGAEVTPAPIGAINGAIFSQIENINRYIEDIGCLHDASLGRIPTGAKSGVSIEALQEGDSNNLSELNENTEEFLEDVYEYVLYLASQKYAFARDIITTTTTGEKKFIKLIGEDADDSLKGNSADPTEAENDNQGNVPAQSNMKSKVQTTVITKKNVVDVKITSWLAYTSEGRRQAVNQLSQALAASGQPLDPQTILEAYSVGPIADIVKRMEQTLEKKQKAENEQNKQQAQNTAQAQAQQGLLQEHGKAQIAAAHAEPAQAPAQPAVTGQQAAIAMIRQLLNGQQPAMPDKVDPDFINYLDHFIASPEGQKQGGAFLQELQNIRDHLVLQMQGNPDTVNNKV